MEVEQLANARSNVLDDLIALAQGFVETLTKEDFTQAEAQFTQTMQQALPLEQLQQTWQALIAQVGPLKTQAGAQHEKIGQYDRIVVRCEFARAPLQVRIVFNADRQIAGLFFTPVQEDAAYIPPSYVNLEAFREQETHVGTGDWALPATLSLPVGAGPFPAVVLVHGSGPNDRDETVGQLKPFRDLAWGLASRNVAVLRYEKRTKAHAGQMAAQRERLTVKEEVVDDALAAVARLCQVTTIDLQRIFLLGHSLGGTLIPRIGKRGPHLAGLIVLAGSTRPLEDVYLEQLEYVLSLGGPVDETKRAYLAQVRQQVARIKQLNQGTVRPDEVLLEVPAAYWLDLHGYDPAAEAKDVKHPLLILQGGRDYQVTLEDFQRWQEALAARPDVTFKLYPMLNHPFVAGSGRGRPEEYLQPGHMAREVIDDIARWIAHQHT